MKVFYSGATIALIACSICSKSSGFTATTSRSFGVQKPSTSIRTELQSSFLKEQDKKLKRGDLEKLSAVAVADADASSFEEENSLLIGDWMENSVKPIIATSLLITGNTIGAGTLVMPEIAAGPGMALSTGVFVGK